MSRVNVPFNASNAQLSLASIQPPSTSPRHSGRIPFGSRAPIMHWSVMITREKEPFIIWIVSMRARSSPFLYDLAMSLRMTSVSLLHWNVQPDSSSISLSCS